jgi:hypothetical protein
MQLKSILKINIHIASKIYRLAPLIVLGLDEYNKKDYRGAIENYNQAIKLNTEYTDAYNNRG